METRYQLEQQGKLHTRLVGSSKSTLCLSGHSEYPLVNGSSRQLHSEELPCISPILLKVTLRLRLTAEQIEIIHACGSEVLPISGHQFHILSQQRRIFHSGECAVVVRRPSGFLETRGTLELLLTQHGEAVRAFPTIAELPPALEAVVEATGAASRGGHTMRAPGRPERRAPMQTSASEPASSPAAEEICKQPAILSTTTQGSCAAGSSPSEGHSGALSQVQLPLPDRAQVAQPSNSSPLQPAVPIEESIRPDYLVCLEDGRKMKMLTRHIRTAFGLSPEQYRERWSLPPDYPMVAPDTANRRLAIAKQPRPGAKGHANRKQGTISAET